MGMGLKKSVFVLVGLAVLGLTSLSFGANVYIPHITAGASDWSDYLQVDNNSVLNADFTVTLYNEGAQVYTGTHQVSRLGETVIKLKELSSTATCGQITYLEDALVFRLTFMNSGGGVAEFILSDMVNYSLGFYFNGVDDIEDSGFVEWKGIALANLGSTSAAVTMYALGDGTLLGTASTTVNAYSRIIGLHTDFFPGIAVDDLKKIIVVSSNGSLCGIVKNGKLDNVNLLFVPAIPVFDFDTGSISGTDVTGLWTGTWFSLDYYTGGNLTGDMTQSGSNLSGTLSATSTDCGDISAPFTGTVSGSTLTLEASYSCMSQTATFGFTQAIIAGNTMSGSYSVMVGGEEYDSGIFTLNKN